MMDICMDDTVPFKVFVIQAGSNKPEVRRFGIDKGAVASFQYLSAKITSVFPSIRDKTFTVSWKDSDGDEITISSDDELLIALTNMSDDLKKLLVTVEGQPDRHVAFDCFVPRHTPPTFFNEEVKFPERPAMSRDIGSECHEGVICDSCNGPVCGFRYKCVICSNFDLCSNCESQHQHEHHFVLRIPFNYGNASHVVSRALGYKLLKVLRKGGLSDMENFKSDDEDFGGRSSKKFYKKLAKDHHHWERKHHKDHKHQRPHSNLFKYVTDYMNDFVNLVSDVDPNDAPNPDADAAKAGGDTSAAAGVSRAAEASASAETSTAGNAASANANAESTQRTKRRRDSLKMRKAAFHEEYLHDIGRTVAKILDPFGIDVDIEIKSKKTKSTAETPQAGVASTSKDIPSTSAAGLEENKQTHDSNAATQNVDNEQNSARAATNISPSPDRNDGWTLINDDPSDSELQSANATHPLLPTSIIASELDKFAKKFQQHLKLQSDPKQNDSEASEKLAKIYPNIAGLVETPYNARGPFSNQVGSTPPPSVPTTPTEITIQSVSGDASPKQATPPPQSSGNDAAKVAAPQPQRASQPQSAEQNRATQQAQKPQHSQTSQQPQRPQQVPHHLPHIAAALEQMISMGFTNDGGWLTQLLESRNGNISAVLDLLTPVSKKN